MTRKPCNVCTIRDDCDFTSPDCLIPAGKVRSIRPELIQRQWVVEEDEYITHGTASAYNRGCRCDECKAANTAKTKAYIWHGGLRPYELRP